MRFWFVVSVLCGCTASSNAPSEDDPLVGTWSTPGVVWSIHADGTWSLVVPVRPPNQASGTWSRAGAQATFVTSSEPGTASITGSMTVTPLRSGDRLVITDKTGNLPVGANRVYPQISGGSTLADTTWGADTTTSDQGGSCSFVEMSFRLMLHGDGTAMSTMRVACQPANMPSLSSMTGTWSSIEHGDAFTLEVRDPFAITQTWARFGAGIASGFFVRVP